MILRFPLIALSAALVLLLGCASVDPSPRAPAPQWEQAYQHIRSALVPVVREGAEIDRRSLAARAMGQRGWRIPKRPLGETMCVAVAVDQPNSLAFVTEADLTRWGIGLDQLLADASANLMARQAPEFFAIPVGATSQIMVASGHLAESQVMTPTSLGTLGLAGDPVVVFHKRHQLTVVGSDDHRALDALSAWLAEGDPAAATPGMIRWDGRRWQPFLPPEDATAHRTFRRFRAEYLTRVFGDQIELLSRVHRLEGRDVFVPKCQLVHDQATGNTFNYTVWIKGVESIIPRCDMVIFATGQARRPTILGHASWSDVARSLDGYLKPIGLTPERYSLRGFPTSEQLAAMGIIARAPKLGAVPAGSPRER